MRKWRLAGDVAFDTVIAVLAKEHFEVSALLCSKGQKLANLCRTLHTSVRSHSILYGQSASRIPSGS